MTEKDVKLTTGFKNIFINYFTLKDLSTKSVFLTLNTLMCTHLLFFEGGNITNASSWMYGHSFLKRLKDINDVLKDVFPGTTLLQVDDVTNYAPADVWCVHDTADKIGNPRSVVREREKQTD